MTTQRPTITNGGARFRIGQLAALVLNGSMTEDEARKRVDDIARAGTCERRAWAQGLLKWHIDNPHLAGTLMLTLAKADTCASEIPHWCGEGAGRHLFAVACMQGAGGLSFQMAGRGYGKLIVGLDGVNWKMWTVEQRRELDRVKKMVKRFIHRAMREGFMRLAVQNDDQRDDDQQIYRRHGHDPARMYELTTSGITLAVLVLEDNPDMMRYAIDMGWYTGTPIGDAGQVV